MSTIPLQWSVDIKAAAHAPAEFSYEASPGELEGLKRYAEVEDLTSFMAYVKAVPLGQGKFRVSGKLQARLVQPSVVDLKAVPSFIEESFSVDFWPEGSIEDEDEEALPFDTDPPEPFKGDRIPIGALLCELFLLSIDPYPRNEGDEFHWAPPSPEPESGPFADLAHFRPRKAQNED
jgi:hypothetical protein